MSWVDSSRWCIMSLTGCRWRSRRTRSWFMSPWGGAVIVYGHDDGDILDKHTVMLGRILSILMELLLRNWTTIKQKKQKKTIYIYIYIEIGLTAVVLKCVTLCGKSLFFRRWSHFWLRNTVWKCKPSTGQRRFHSAIFSCSCSIGRSTEWEVLSIQT